MKRTFSLFFVLSLLFLFSCHLSGFDGKRKGFVLGIGAGGGFTSYTATEYRWYWLDYYPYFYDEYIQSKESGAGLATDFKIGFGATDQLLILYSNKVIWFSFQDPDWDSSQTTITGITSVGLSYFFKPTAPSFFISGGVGASVWAPFQSTYEDERWIGPGFYGGFGYEFSPRVYIEFSGILARGGSLDTDDAGKNPFSIMVTLNFLLY